MNDVSAGLFYFLQYFGHEKTLHRVCRDSSLGFQFQKGLRIKDSFVSCISLWLEYSTFFLKMIVYSLNEL